MKLYLTKKENKRNHNLIVFIVNIAKPLIT